MSSFSSSHLLPNCFANALLISRQPEIQDKRAQEAGQRACQASYLFLHGAAAQHTSPWVYLCLLPSSNPRALPSKPHVWLPWRSCFLSSCFPPHSSHQGYQLQWLLHVILLSSPLSVSPVNFLLMEKFPDFVYCEFSEEFINFRPPTHLQAPVIVSVPTLQGKGDSRRQKTLFC